MLNRWVLSRDRKTATEGAEVTRSGRLFQTRAAATGKARSPMVDSRVRLTINDDDELERSRWRASTSATWQISSVRYPGADPWRHLYTRTAYLNAIRSGAFSAYRRSDPVASDVWKNYRISISVPPFARGASLLSPHSLMLICPLPILWHRRTFGDG